MAVKHQDITGIKFSHLTAIRRVGSDVYRTSLWECKCDCGKTITTRLTSLKSGHTKSCGNCLFDHPNAYTDNGKFMIGSFKNGDKFYFDYCDAGKVMSKKWYVDKSGYPSTNKAMPMHRIIMPREKGMVTDHINGNGFDNRRINLRTCTQQQNVFNQRKRTAKTSSIYKGVSFCKRSKKYVAYISKDRKRHQLGLFDSESSAACAYNKKATELFGEYALLNVI